MRSHLRAQQGWVNTWGCGRECFPQIFLKIWKCIAIWPCSAAKRALKGRCTHQYWGKANIKAGCWLGGNLGRHLLSYNGRRLEWMLLTGVPGWCGSRRVWKRVEWWQSSLRKELGPWVAPGPWVGYCIVQLLGVNTQTFQKWTAWEADWEQTQGGCRHSPFFPPVGAKPCPNQLHGFPDKWQVWMGSLLPCKCCSQPQLSFWSSFILVTIHFPTKSHHEK